MSTLPRFDAVTPEPHHRDIVATSSSTGSSSSKMSHDKHRNLQLAMQKSIVNLMTWNWAMAVFHGAFVGVTLATANIDLTVPLYKMTFASVNNTSETPSSGNSSQSSNMDDTAAWVRPKSAVPEEFSLPLTWLMLAFSGLSCAFHFGNAALWKESYMQGIRDARCPSRWIEYSISASTMGVAIAYLVGIQTTTGLVAIFALIATTMFFGHLCEEISRPDPVKCNVWHLPFRTRIQPHVLGWAPFGAAIALMLHSFFYLESTFPQMPDFVVYIIFSQIGLFSSFSLYNWWYFCGLHTNTWTESERT